MTKGTPTPEKLDELEDVAKQVETHDSDGVLRVLKRVGKRPVEKRPAK
jgi:hypothetical protein